MLWHVVRFRFPEDVDPEARASLERDLAALGDAIDEIAWLAVERDIEDPQVTGLLSGFAGEAELAVYRDHPAHVPVAARARQLAEEVHRLDVVAPVPPPDAAAAG